MYKNMLVTGGCGFIGSNFINTIFSKFDGNIINIDKINYCSNENNIKPEIQSSDRYKLIKGCLSNYQLVSSILSDNEIDIIIHFAAQSHVTLSYTNTNDFIQDNIVSSYNLLEAIKNYGKVKLFINMSTDEVYGESQLDDETPMKETSMLNPTNPYSSSKACVEMLSKSYYHSYKIPLITLRCNNVYGENQYHEKVIPRFIKQLKSGKKITIEGTGLNTRTFIHTSDVCNAIERVIQDGEIGEIYNIGNNSDEYSIIDVGKILIKKIKNTENYEDYIEYVKDRVYNDMRYFISYEKLKKLGWKPESVFMEEIERLIACY